MSSYYYLSVKPVLPILIFTTQEECDSSHQAAVKESWLEQQLQQYGGENERLRKHVVQLLGEVNGARLAAKYLDKELAGRYLFIHTFFSGAD